MPHFAHPLLRSPRLGFGLTTGALIALASGGTGVLVANGAHHLDPGRTPPPLALGPVSPAVPLVVPRAPGSLPQPTPARVPVQPPPVTVTGTGPAAVAPPPPPVVVVPPRVVVPPPVVVPLPVVTPPAPPPTVRPHHLHHDNGKHLGQLKHH